LALIGHLRHPGLPETSAQPTAAKTGHVADRRPGNPVAAHGVPERHRPSAAVHAHGCRVHACAQKSRRTRRSRVLRWVARIRIGRWRTRRLRIRPSAAVATRAREYILKLYRLAEMLSGFRGHSKEYDYYFF